MKPLNVSHLAMFTLLALLSISAPCYAQNESTPPVPMVSGGIGDDGDFLAGAQKKYDLKLLFTETGGAYIADVSVHIEDKAGHAVADTVSRGPYLLMNLPAGEYKVKAGFAGEVQQQKIRVKPGTLPEHQFRFHAQDADY